MKISVITVFNGDQTSLKVLKKIEVKDTFNATY